MITLPMVAIEPDFDVAPEALLYCPRCLCMRAFVRVPREEDPRIVECGTCLYSHGYRELRTDDGDGNPIAVTLTDVPNDHALSPFIRAGRAKVPVLTREMLEAGRRALADRLSKTYQGKPVPRSAKAYRSRLEEIQRAAAAEF